MDKQAIELPGAAKYGPYSAGVQSGDMFWLSGQIAVDFDGVKAQTQGALDKIDMLLNNAGLTRENICFAQILLDDINDFAAMNEIYGDGLVNYQLSPQELLLPLQHYLLAHLSKLSFKAQDE